MQEASRQGVIVRESVWLHQLFDVAILESHEELKAQIPITWRSNVSFGYFQTLSTDELNDVGLRIC